MVQLFSSWPIGPNGTPPTITVETDCLGPVTRQCQVTHDRSVAAAQGVEGQAPTGAVTHWTVPPS